MKTSDIGTAILRIALGVVLLAHSAYLKLVVFGLAGTAGYFESIGLPSALAYLVFGIEVIAGSALILGLRTRLAALTVVPVLAGATWAHWQSGWLFANDGGGWEYPAVLTVLALGQALLGPGSWAIDHSTRELRPKIPATVVSS